VARRVEPGIGVEPVTGCPVPALCGGWAADGVRGGDGVLAGTAVVVLRPEASTTAPAAPPAATAAVTAPAILFTTLMRWVRVTRAVYSRGTAVRGAVC
jgi:hypothetical protein